MHGVPFNRKVKTFPVFSVPTQDLFDGVAEPKLHANDAEHTSAVSVTFRMATVKESLPVVPAADVVHVKELALLVAATVKPPPFAKFVSSTNVVTLPVAREYDVMAEQLHADPLHVTRSFDAQFSVVPKPPLAYGKTPTSVTQLHTPAEHVATCPALHCVRLCTNGTHAQTPPSHEMACVERHVGAV